MKFSEPTPLLAAPLLHPVIVCKVFSGIGKYFLCFCRTPSILLAELAKKKGLNGLQEWLTECVVTAWPSDVRGWSLVVVY